MYTRTIYIYIYIHTYIYIYIYTLICADIALPSAQSPY